MGSNQVNLLNIVFVPYANYINIAILVLIEHEDKVVEIRLLLPVSLLITLTFNQACTQELVCSRCDYWVVNNCYMAAICELRNIGMPVASAFISVSTINVISAKMPRPPHSPKNVIGEAFFEFEFCWNDRSGIPAEDFPSPSKRGKGAEIVRSRLMKRRTKIRA